MKNPKQCGAISSTEPAEAVTTRSGVNIELILKTTPTVTYVAPPRRTTIQPPVVSLLFSWKTFYLEDTSCVLCQDAPMEFMQHLFFGCEFSQIFWWRLNQEWNYDMDLYDMLTDGRSRAGYSCFTEYLIIGCWSLWCHRNSIIFDGGQLNIDTCCSIFKEFFSLTMHRAKPSLKEGMQQWLDAM